MESVKEDLNHELYLICGSRGSGKTSKLKNYKKNKKRDYLEGLICCPTAGSFTSSYDDFLTDVPRVMALDEKQMIEELTDFIDRSRKDSNRFSKRLKYHEKLKKMEESGEHDKDKIKELKNIFPLLKPPHRYLVLDDCQGMRLLKSPMFLSFLIRHRHHCCDVYILVQNPKGVSPVIRSNSTRVSIFPYKGSKILKTLYEEYAPMKDMTEEEFNDLLKKLERYQSLTIDFNKTDDNGKIYVNVD